MSKIKLLLDVVEDLRKLADDIQSVADAMTSGESATAPEQVAPAETASAPEPKDSKPAKAPSKEEVRAVLARKKVEDARALILKFGASKLTEVDAKDYAAMLEEAKQLPDDDKRNGGNA